MNILFAAGDVGGARALLPVAHLAAAQGVSVLGLAHGVFRAEGATGWHWLSMPEAEQQAQTADVTLYATSVADAAAVSIAQQARAAGRPIVHLLDNWSSYASRIAPLMPDAYAVMDDLARNEALAEGVPKDCLFVTGHPDIAKLAQEARHFGPPIQTNQRKTLFFASEPAAMDGGTLGRGYDEEGVARALMLGLARFGIGQESLRLLVAPHPREDRARVQARFQTYASQIPKAPEVGIVAPSEVRRSLHSATHVAGMTSILLYEAWLLGRATLSLQPGLHIAGLRTLSQRSGVIFHTSPHGIDEAIAAWLERPADGVRPDLELHANAAQNVLDLARRLADARPLSPKTSH